MPAFSATIRHHSISRARVVSIEGTLAQAKRAATREFAGDFNFYEIVLLDADGREIASRRLDAKRWTDRPF